MAKPHPNLIGHRMWTIVYTALGITLIGLLYCTPAQTQKNSRDISSRVEETIDSLHLSQAEQLIKTQQEQHGDSAELHYLRGKLLFYRGEFVPALTELRIAIENAKTNLEWKHLRDRIILSKNISEKLTVTVGPSGKFRFFHSDSLDSLLVPYADNALAKQQAQLTEMLSDRFAPTLDIYILPDVETLSDMCGLSVQQIESTGTVGISKYNRVMILSPKMISGGYPWLETLTHELTHISITRLSRNKAPIWIQEGVAKLLESLWRTQKYAELAPEEAYLLDRAAKERRLIPLRRFHPSVALLPNQEDALLAYAQVLSFMLYLDMKLERANWVKDLLHGLSINVGVDQIFTDLTNFPLKRLYTWWEQEIRGKRHAPVTLLPMMKKRFKSGATTGEAAIDSLLSTNVKRHIRLGDLLRLRGHIHPAILEYRRALALNESAVPDITDRLSGCLLDTQQYHQVVELLEPLTSLYPFHATLFVQLGTAHMNTNSVAKAGQALRRAIGIDPFHPNVHCMLSTIYEKAGSYHESKMEKEHCFLMKRN